ncbi:TRAP transporter large permease subunit [Gammaproteobacteria bacterium]|nr:TRAP transporter large permease subunit [Gammaproteobacteria bacterium]
MTTPDLPILHRIENSISILILVVMAAMPLLEVLTRELIGGGIPGSIPIVQHLMLWITLLGAALAARTDRNLALSTASFFKDPWQQRMRVFTAFLAVGVTACLFVASVQLVLVDHEYGDIVTWGIPVWVFTAIMPLAFAIILGRMIRHASDRWAGRFVAVLGLAVPLVLGFGLDLQGSGLLLPLGILLLIGTALGMPIFTTIGGAALLLFIDEGTPISAVPGEAYRMSTSPMLPAIPLFTFAGYILAEGGSSRRLLRLFSALVGWMPGGLAVVTTLVLAFFTPLTGASGITILAMGGLLLPMLVKANYRESTAVGLVTVSGSIGIMFPPSLPVILYAYYAEVALDKLFVAGLLPGLLLVVAIAAWGAWRGWFEGARRTQFSGRKLRVALWQAKWEVVLPVVIITCIFGGFATLVEAAALTVLYAIVVECLVFKELNFIRDGTRIAAESATMIGGFMIILGMALGLTNYLVIAQVPMHALDWIQSVIESPLLFLLMINILLIVVGALMDIYSAIIVIVPLIAPMAAAYGIDPVHMGIIFLANSQLGYLMPPMGENLFLSAYRFDLPLTRIYRYTLPCVGILLITVLLITYWPELTLWLPRVIGL